MATASILLRIFVEPTSTGRWIARLDGRVLCISVSTVREIGRNTLGKGIST